MLYVIFVGLSVGFLACWIEGLVDKVTSTIALHQQADRDMLAKFINEHCIDKKGNK